MSTTEYVFVIAQNGDEQRIEFDEKTTLLEFKKQITEHLFGIKEEQKFPNKVPSRLRLIWCGVDIKYGASWHTGRIGEDEDMLMKDLSPGLKHGQPAIHADFGLVQPK
jgi:hypothetical protein